ncbi:MAG: substrate-binding domain-containing protein [Olegusella sp.]|nr:substrate-binding domain-containing protein [Olegusella sp.]
MSTLSRRNFLKAIGATMLSGAAMGVAGCDSSGNGGAGAAGSADGEEKYPAGSTLRIGSDCGYAPFSWVQSDDSNGAVAMSDGSGYVGGYDSLIADKICEANDWTPQFVRVDWDGIIPALNAGTFDCIIASMSVTEERKQSVDFSDFYWSSPQGVVCLKDSQYASATSLEDFSGAKIAAQTGTFEDDIIDQIPDVQHENSMADQNTLIVAIQSGVIDGTVLGETEAQSVMKSNPDLAFVMLDSTIGGTEKGKGFDYDLSNSSAAIAVRKGDTELLDKINKVLADLDRDEEEQMMQEAFDNQPLSVSE